MSIKLKDSEVIKEDIMALVEVALDYIEVLCLNRENYDVIRRKLLRKGNDLCRKISALMKEE